MGHVTRATPTAIDEEIVTHGHIEGSLQPSWVRKSDITTSIVQIDHDEKW